MKLSRIALTDRYFQGARKNSQGVIWTVEGDQLAITKSPGCGDVWIKGIYGFEHEERDY